MSEPEIWLVSYLKATGKPSLPYNDAVEEALCFGWIDSTRKTLTEDSRAQRFSPRRKGAPWSEMNKERVRRLHAQGLMTEAGLAAGVDFLDEAFEVPDDILAAINADEETRAHFETFPESYVRIRVGWIDGVRNRPEEFDKRLRYFLKMTKQGKRFGMVQ
ncbi:MAG: YdeI family protein [Dehalococcoidia bacterium]